MGLNGLANKSEARMARRVVDKVMAGGYVVSVWEGEGWAIEDSNSRNDIIEALASTDEDTLYLHRGRDCVGMIHLVYGNGSEDLIQDNTDNKEINELVQLIEGTD